MILTVLLSTSLLSPAQLPSAVVLPTEPKGADAALAASVSAEVVRALKTSGALGNLVGTDGAAGVNVDERLRSCDSEGCVAELAGSLGADFLVTSSLGRIGGYYAFSLKVVSIKSGALAGSASATVCAERETELASVVGPMVRDALGGARLLAAAPAAEPMHLRCGEGPGAAAQAAPPSGAGAPKAQASASPAASAADTATAAPATAPRRIPVPEILGVSMLVMSVVPALAFLVVGVVALASLAMTGGPSGITGDLQATVRNPALVSVAGLGLVTHMVLVVAGSMVTLIAVLDLL